MCSLQGYLRKNTVRLWKNGTEMCKHSLMVPPFPKMGAFCRPVTINIYIYTYIQK